MKSVRGAKCSARHVGMNRAAWKNRYTEAKLNHLDDCLGALDVELTPQEVAWLNLAAEPSAAQA